MFLGISSSSAAFFVPISLASFTASILIFHHTVFLFPFLTLSFIFIVFFLWVCVMFYCNISTQSTSDDFACHLQADKMYFVKSKAIICFSDEKFLVYGLKNVEHCSIMEMKVQAEK